MRPARELLKHEPRSRLFFIAHAQSSLGTGAGYVALLVLAYDRFPSPWAISLVLLADFLPSMFLGPLFGAAADRWSRRRCAVIADLARAVAFVGIGLTGGFAATVAFALLAGAGTGLFRPAVLAGLPSLVERRRLSAATSLYGALDDLGHTLGPVAAAVFLAATSPDALIVVNGLTFAVSAALLVRVPFGAIRDRRAEPRASLVTEARRGLGAARRIPGVRVIVLASSAVVLFAGLFNVGELLLATEELGAGPAGFSLLVAVFGCGVVAGSLLGSRGGPLPQLKHHYLTGLFVVGVGFVASGLAPGFEVALATFALAGLGNGLVVVHERILLQEVVAEGLLGRVFGVKDALTSWCFAAAFLLAGVVASAVPTRVLFLVAGAGALAIFAAASVALRGTWTDRELRAPEPTRLGRLAAG